MKILLTSELYTPLINGVVTSTSTLCKALIERGHDVRVLTLSAKKEKYFENNIYYNSAFSADFIYPHASFAFSLDSEYYKDILAWGPDIIHTQSEFSTYNFAKKIAKVLNIPLVHTYHTSYEDYTHYIFIPKKYAPSFTAFCLKHTLKASKAIIAPTGKIKTMLENYGIRQDISIIPTGIDLKEQYTTLEERLALKKEIGLNVEKKVLLSLGRIAKEKNIETLIEYMALFKEDTYQLLIVGGGPDKERLEKKVQALGIRDKVFFTGMVSPAETYKYYQLGDIFVCASTSETQGLTYIEALSHKLPLLCVYDICLENVLIPEENGYLFTCFEDFEANAKKIVDATSKSNDMQEKARQIAEKYSISVFAEKVEKVYCNALDT